MTQALRREYLLRQQKRPKATEGTRAECCAALALLHQGLRSCSSMLRRTGLQTQPPAGPPSLPRKEEAAPCPAEGTRGHCATWAWPEVCSVRTLSWGLLEVRIASCPSVTSTTPRQCLAQGQDGAGRGSGCLRDETARCEPLS